MAFCYNHKNITYDYCLCVTERLELQIGLQNPLQISLPVTRLRLLWVWSDAEGHEVDGNGDPANVVTESQVAITDEMPSLLLPPQATHFVSLLSWQ